MDDVCTVVPHDFTFTQVTSDTHDPAT